MFPRTLFLLLLAALSAGCAAIPANRGYGTVEALVAERGTHAPVINAEYDAARIDALVLDTLSQPLRAQDAVEIALLKNPTLRRGYAELGIAQAELYDAARLSNPTLSLAWLDSNESGAADFIGVGLSQDFLDLLMLGPRKRVAEREVLRAQQLLAAEILKLRREVESAWFAHVSALQIAQMRELIARATDVSARLAQRFFDAGNINRLELQLEWASASQARIEADQATAEAEVARNDLNQLMGLTDDQSRWRVTDKLPLPVAEEDAVVELQHLAQSRRLELSAAAEAVEQRQQLLALTRRYRYFGSLEAGVDYERETDRSRLLGPTLALQLPIFNQGGGAVLSAEAALEAEAARLKALEIEISNEVALASKKVGVARKLLTTYRERLLPQREEIVQRSQELQSYMIIGQFELLRSKREQYDAYEGYLEALRDYWLARTDLAAATGGSLPSAAQVGNPSIDVETLTRPPADAHTGHGAMGGMDMKGMDMKAPATQSMPGMDHSGHQQPGSVQPPMKPMPGMDHSGHKMSPAPPSGDGMKGMDMKGMERMKSPAPPSAPSPQSGHSGHSGHQNSQEHKP